MSRPIKFRAWDGHKMIIPQDHCYYQSYVSFCGTIVQKNREGMDCMGGGDVWSHIRDVELMQFTGLTDKNGVEIYESDILALKTGAKHAKILPVKWSSTSACFCCYDGLALYGGKQCEVIGNVHQNKDLLD